MYKFYNSGNKVIAVSTYAGRTVRGVAKCDPRDTFDIEVGKDIAAARCNIKVSRKRKARALREYDKAAQALARAWSQQLKMRDYLADAEREVNQAEENLKILMNNHMGH